MNPSDDFSAQEKRLQIIEAEARAEKAFENYIVYCKQSVRLKAELVELVRAENAPNPNKKQTDLPFDVYEYL